MRTTNYKGENYLDTSSDLIQTLDAICETLVANLSIETKSYTVEEIINAKSFYELWEHTPNAPKNKKLNKEFKGLYAFALVNNEGIDFMYVGISKRTGGRFADHTKGVKSNYASWAYLMIKHTFPELTTRKEREAKIADYQKEHIYPLRFTFCPIDDNMLLHLAEVYAANKLKAKWNSFETH